MMINSWSTCQQSECLWSNKFIERTQFFAAILHDRARRVWTCFARWPMICCPNLFSVLRVCRNRSEELNWRLVIIWWRYTTVWKQVRPFYRQGFVVGCLTDTVGKKHIIELQKSNLGLSCYRKCNNIVFLLKSSIY